VYQIAKQFCYNLHQKHEKLYRDTSWTKLKTPLSMS
jgi:hypothetical protein